MHVWEEEEAARCRHVVHLKESAIRLRYALLRVDNAGTNFFALNSRGGETEGG